MKRALLLLFIAAAWAVSARADLIVVQKVESHGQTSEVTMQMKDNRSRTDISAAMSMITNKDTGDMVTLMHSQKIYMKISGAATKALIDEVKKAASGGNTPPKLQPTGKKQKINGFETEEYTTSFGAMKMNYWIARNYPEYKGILAQMMKFQRGSLSAVTKGMAPAAEDFPGMPIRTEMEAAGRDTVMTLVSVSQAAVDPKVFEIPADYKEVAMPSFPMGSSTVPAPAQAPPSPAQ